MGNIDSNMDGNNSNIIVNGVDYSYSQWSVVKRGGVDFLAVNVRKLAAIKRLNNGKKDISSEKRMYMEVFGIIGTAIFGLMLVSLFRHFFGNDGISWIAVATMTPISLVGVFFLGRLMVEDYFAATKQRLFKLDPNSSRQDLDDLKHYLNEAVERDAASAQRVISNILADDNKYSHVILSSDDYEVIRDNEYVERITHNKYIAI